MKRLMRGRAICVRHPVMAENWRGVPLGMHRINREYFFVAGVTNCTHQLLRAVKQKEPF